MINNDNMLDLENLEKILDYKFKNKSFAIMAFSHTSYVNERKHGDIGSYERLEFLGDSVVNMIVSEYLYKNFPQFPEGELTRIRAIVVCEPTFAEIARSMRFGEFLLLGKGEKLSGGRERVSILADVFEAVTCAIYLDGGFNRAKKFVLDNLHYVINAAVTGAVFMDYKTQLQEIIQKDSSARISYSTISEIGPDHDKEFIIKVLNDEKVLGEGKGKSKKEAEQMAAKDALEKMRIK